MRVEEAVMAVASGRDVEAVVSGLLETDAKAFAEKLWKEGLPNLKAQHIRGKTIGGAGWGTLAGIGAGLYRHSKLKKKYGSEVAGSRLKRVAKYALAGGLIGAGAGRLEAPYSQERDLAKMKAAYDRATKS